MTIMTTTTIDLPVELVQDIVEYAADIDQATAKMLMQVCKEMLPWAATRLFHTANFLRASAVDRFLSIADDKTAATHAFLPYVMVVHYSVPHSTRPFSYWRPKTLPLQRIVDATKNVIRLYVLDDGFQGVSSLRLRPSLRRLTYTRLLRPGSLALVRGAFYAPPSLTHLRISLAYQEEHPRALRPILDQLPCLTHLALQPHSGIYAPFLRSGDFGLVLPSHIQMVVVIVALAQDWLQSTERSSNGNTRVRSLPCAADPRVVFAALGGPSSLHGFGGSALQKRTVDPKLDWVWGQ